jgi:hypothetical protein
MKASKHHACCHHPGQGLLVQAESIYSRLLKPLKFCSHTLWPEKSARTDPSNSQNHESFFWGGGRGEAVNEASQPVEEWFRGKIRGLILIVVRPWREEKSLHFIPV